MPARPVFVAEGVVLLGDMGVHSLGDGTLISISLAKMISWQELFVHARELFWQ